MFAGHVRARSRAMLTVGSCTRSLDVAHGFGFEQALSSLSDLAFGDASNSDGARSKSSLAARSLVRSSKGRSNSAAVDGRGFDSGLPFCHEHLPGILTCPINASMEIAEFDFRPINEGERGTWTTWTYRTACLRYLKNANYSQTLTFIAYSDVFEQTLKKLSGNLTNHKVSSAKHPAPRAPLHTIALLIRAEWRLQVAVADSTSVHARTNFQIGYGGLAVYAWPMR